MFEKGNVVHHDLLYGKILQVLPFKCLSFIAEWIRLAIISMLAEDHSGFESLSQSRRHKSRVIIKALKSTFVTSVKEDRTCLIWIKFLINDISECKHFICYKI